MDNLYRRVEYPEITVLAIQFKRENLADCIIFTGSALKNIRVASKKPYHKFHCTMFDQSLCEGMWIVQLPGGEFTALDNDYFNSIYEKVK